MSPPPPPLRDLLARVWRHAAAVEAATGSRLAGPRAVVAAVMALKLRGGAGEVAAAAADTS
jgi:hypothetical protein